MSTDPNVWIGTLPKTTNRISQENSKLNPDKWISSVPKKKVVLSKRKYSLTIILFVISLTVVSLIKNETRNLQKEINNLQTSINNFKLNLHKEILDHEIITSPENIFKLANKYLELDLVFYNKSQLKQLNENKTIAPISENQKNNKTFTTKTKKAVGEIKLLVKKQIQQKKNDLKKVKELYSNPKELPDQIRYQVTKKIENKKSSLRNLYRDPSGSINKGKIQNWALVQVFKAFAGIPIIPGK